MSAEARTPPFALNHVALGARNPEGLARFYEEVLGLERIHVARRPDEEVRAVWLQLTAETILMIERALEATQEPAGEASPESPPGDFMIDRFEPGYRLMALQIGREESGAWVERLARAGTPVLHRSEYTLYFRDPEGNPLGLSWFDPALYLEQTTQSPSRQG